MSKTREERALALAREILRVPVGFTAASDEVHCILIRLADAEAERDRWKMLATASRLLDHEYRELGSPDGWHYLDSVRMWERDTQESQELRAERDELRARVAGLERHSKAQTETAWNHYQREHTNTPDLAAKVAVLEERVLRLERVAVGVRRSPQLRSDILRDLQSREDWGK